MEYTLRDMDDNALVKLTASQLGPDGEPTISAAFITLQNIISHTGNLKLKYAFVPGEVAFIWPVVEIDGKDVSWVLDEGPMPVEDALEIVKANINQSPPLELKDKCALCNREFQTYDVTYGVIDTGAVWMVCSACYTKDMDTQFVSFRRGKDEAKNAEALSLINAVHKAN